MNQFDPQPATGLDRVAPPSQYVMAHGSALLPGYQFCYVCMFEATKLPVDPEIAVTTVKGTCVCDLHVTAISNHDLLSSEYLAQLSKRVIDDGAR